MNFVFSSIMSVLFMRVFGCIVFVSSLKLIVGDKTGFRQGHAVNLLTMRTN